MNKNDISLTLSFLSFLLALVSLFISYRSFARDNHKLVFETYYTFEDYQGRKDGDFDNISLIVRNIGRRVAIIKQVGLYVGENIYNQNHNNLPKLLPGYASKYFLELSITEPIKINENEEVTFQFIENMEIFELMKQYLNNHNQKGIIAVLDSRGETHYIPINPSMKIEYSL